MTYSFQWRRCDSSGTGCADVPAAVSQTYPETDADVGSTMRCLVTRASDGMQVLSGPSGVVQPASSPGVWVPAAPGSYHATGTFSKFVQVGTATGSTPDFALFHTQRQHIVGNSGGYFFAYNYVDNNHNPAHWILIRSTDGGNTWSTVYNDSTFNNGGGAPAVETDAVGNVYVVVSQYGDLQNYFKIYRFSPGNGYGSPTVWSFPSFGAANKWGCNFDQTRNWIWIKAWQRSGPGEPDLLAVDLTGAVQVSAQLFKPFSATSGYAHADAEYPFVEVLHDGSIVVAWNNVAEPVLVPGIPLSYYDDRLIQSPDGGATWYGPGGAIAASAVEADDTGTAANRGWVITNPAAGVEFIPATDPNYFPNGTAKYNFNAIGNIAYHKGAVHFWYTGASPAGVVGGAHRSYARFDWGSKTVDLRHNPLLAGDGADYDSLNGTFCQDSAQASRLYLLGVGEGPDFGSLLVTKTDDAGVTWDRYATHFVGNLPNYPTCSRFVQTDGSILLGVVQAGSPNGVYFGKIDPA